MRHKIAWGRLLLVVLLLGAETSCAKTPPTIVTPQGVTAFQNLQVLKALDAVRDIAVDANATVPPMLQTDVTRKIVLWHKSAITILNARGAGWPTLIAASLDQVLVQLKPADRQLLAPYVTLVKTILVEVVK